MKFCAEYEDQLTALKAHRVLLDKGADPEEIEIRSPYPLSEHAIPPHRSRPMVVRNVVRLMWLIGLISGFAFITFTQLEWGLTAKTGGQALVAVPITAIIMYECGMLTALLVNTLMFFIETRRYRQLVPALEEDMIVAFGHIALVVSGDAAKKAKDWLSDSGARSMVSYMLPIAFMGMLMSGCATHNMRYQAVIKPGEAPADSPPERSVRMPTLAEQQVTPPQPYGWLYYGDQAASDRAAVQRKTLEKDLDQQVKDGKLRRPQVRAKLKEFDEKLVELEPELWALKSNTIPAELKDLQSPVASDAASLERGEKLYVVNCAQCHGVTGQGDGKVGEPMGIKPAKIGSPEYADRYSDGGFYHFIMTGKNLMPAFGYKLNTREVFDIINYLRKLQGKAA